MEIGILLEKLGYKDDGAFYTKSYLGYPINVNKADYKINYGGKIRYDRETCLNLTHQTETSVVFQCVDKLLTLGYKPENIYLEKSFPSGRRSKGQFLDILVLNGDTPFLMIECKTFVEYNQELAKTERDGGQIFTYYNAERAPKYLCLYTSWLENNRINYISNIIDTAHINGHNKETLYKSWDKTFEKKRDFRR